MCLTTGKLVAHHSCFQSISDGFRNHSSFFLKFTYITAASQFEVGGSENSIVLQGWRDIFLE